MKTEFEFDLKSPTLFVDAIRQGLEQLMSLRNQTPNRAELEWEIRLYRYILRAPEPNIMAKEYFEMRATPAGTRTKRETVKLLKWKVT